MGIDDRDYMREYSIFGGRRRGTDGPGQPHLAAGKPAVPVRRKRNLRRAATIAVCSIALGAAAGFIGTVEAMDRHWITDPNEQPFQMRVWVPKAKYGHVRVILVDP